ncbi:5-methyltetrahydropteroyltriglutamate--homocysteine S-methyltransferase [Motilimonas eburnea]|uniref:5-methyltetrahydropteroyltriglutamate-- homocysteine S-methyltransferase n=1 Tax=Motilimonas eburnea TaxID=1737488 RepID=UPI001E454EA4|nr:5-methyltetrahydropteroyltriglutamate--homocysteine S-methyltransferase [Motilimonas eburnea]MCE2572908.1 5-methyltetrahydropteroyltriglutamate--homocysteine S-methyltransferase [Motilimonas eburnea]
MAKISSLGYPRIGDKRQLKHALEQYWSGQADLNQLLETGKQIRLHNWQEQAQAGVEFVPVGDFAWYDHVLTLSATFGVIPARHRSPDGQINLDTLFAMARGRSNAAHGDHHGCCQPQSAACEMTKWFDTNYHYLVPEFEENQKFELSYSQILDEVKEAIAAGFQPKPVLLGPISYLWLGKAQGNFNKLDLLANLLPAYQDLLSQFKQLGVTWVQLDEPALVLDLPKEWQGAYQTAYQALQANRPKLLVTSYFDSLADNQALALALPIDGLHIDLVRAPEQLKPILQQWPADWVLSAGIINGRNIWRSDLRSAFNKLKPVADLLGDQLWLSPSCSLLHSPVDLDSEQKLDAEIKPWLAFAKQKLNELNQLQQIVNDPQAANSQTWLAESDKVVELRATSPLIHNDEVKQRVANLTSAASQRYSDFATRIKQQQAHLKLPPYPTTTIGSFPQTADIRQTRSAYKQGKIDQDQYIQAMQAEIRQVVAAQEALDLDVLVHGEPERNDMVEYFGELLDGFAFTQYGWVQSYGSRCVKPPIIYGDVKRSRELSVSWSTFAQSLTQRPMKGMLTGPITILCWSFNRDDISRETCAKQIALAIRDEVVALEEAGIKVIQIDEPALREGLPLKEAAKTPYLDWATEAFRISASGVKDETQIHTHMCYCEFNDILPSIAAMDADVITIETSRSNMELLDAFEAFQYPNDIGPGVYDIHSPNVPEQQWMVDLIQAAGQKIAPERLWVNPDCGLKTRNWSETNAALSNMVAAAKTLRANS